MLDRLCCNETKHAGGLESDEEDRGDGVGKTTRRGDEHEQYKEIERINRLLTPCHGMSLHTHHLRPIIRVINPSEKRRKMRKSV